MQYPKPALRLLLGLLLIVLPALSATEPRREPPPEPAYPERSKMTDAAFDAAWSKWRAAHPGWEATLTAGELLKIHAPEKQKYVEPPSSAVPAPKDREPLPPDNSSWKRATAEKGLNAEIVAALESHKIAFGDSVRQSFTPYLSGPVFITSDSVLNAFHILFEESFRELELRRAVRFRADFEQLLTTARKLPREQDILTPERIEPAIRHLERVLGPALVICGTSLDFFDTAVREDIQAQVDLINGAEKTELPAWLAPADSSSLFAIDYSRFRPVGFYTKPALLASYFRAMRWLQLVPFRASRENEFNAMVLLACASHERGVPTDLMSAILGRNDDPSPVELQDALDDRFPRKAESFDRNLADVRNKVVSKLIGRGYYRINTDLREQRTLADTFSQLTFRVVPQASLADSVLFQQLLDHGQKPSGLAVAALLGSSDAQKQLTPAALALVYKARPTPPHARKQGEPALYDVYLDTLRALFLAPAPEAPAFMGSDAWAMKSCHSALGGWAQIRHAFTLQAKTAQYYLSASIVSPGFVEPNPEFFARLSQLITRCDQLLVESGTYLPVPSLEAESLREIAGAFRSWVQDDPNSQSKSALLLKEESLSRISEELDKFAKAKGWSLDKDPSPQEWRTHLQEMADLLEAKAGRYDRGEASVPASESSLRKNWQTLARIVARLEALAHKQLRGQPWTDDEAAFLKRYGEEMANIHGYAGNSWLDPRDDAPRWAEVSGLPGRGTFLAAGIGRPRIIYVLYPWNGMEILCVGSVMQYYEYEGSRRLSDEAWRDLLDSPDAPPLPTWMQPYAKPPAKPAAEH